MATFFLVNPKRKRSTIYILISFRGKKYRRTTGESIPVKQWSNKKKRSKVSAQFREGEFINDVLVKWEEAANRSIAFFKRQRSAPSSSELFAQLDDEFYGKEEAEPPLFRQYLESYINRYKAVRHPSTIKNYTGTLNKITAFEEATGQSLSFDQIDINFYNQFQEWFYAKGLSTNYFGTVIKVVKQAYREARVVDRLHNEFSTDHKDFIAISRPTENIYLNHEELMRLHRVVINKETVAAANEDIKGFRAVQQSEAMNLARQLFLIGAFTGLRVSDFTRLTSDNFDGYIRVRTLKTDSETVIPIHPVIHEILDSGFNLDVAVWPQKINKHIKKVARMAGINDPVRRHKNIGGRRVIDTKPKYQLITNHTARRSFATNAYKAGVPNLAIMQITGHRRESTFLKYIKVTAEENAERLERHPFFSGNAEPNAEQNKTDD